MDDIERPTQIEEDVVEKRKEEVMKFFKKNKNWIFYAILAVITWIGFFIRTRNLDKLRDITTGTWTLGPDLDPFLFLRWAKEIVETGTLAAVDSLRYVPLGYNTAGESKLLSYLIVWFHNVVSTFSITESVTHSAVLFPAVMFVLTTIAFFLFARKVFYKEERITKNVIALIATAFFVLIPSLLPRTIAGIPEKESAALFFMFLAFYFFIGAFTEKKFSKALALGILAGISSGLMALVWGGAVFAFISINTAVFLAFLIGKIDGKKAIIYLVWFLFAIGLPATFSSRLDFASLVSSVSTASAIFVLFVFIVDFMVFKKKVIKIPRKFSEKIPEKILSLIITFVVLAILATIFFGPTFILEMGKRVVGQLIHPLDVSRFGLTVAENRQPSFLGEWANEFGPVVFGKIPLYFWLFFVGAVLLFYEMVKKIGKKERLIFTAGYIVFLSGLIFSRYSPDGVLNGDSGLSFIVYFGGILIFLGLFLRIYLQKSRDGGLFVFEKFEFSYILYFIILTLGVIGARGAVRLVMVLGALSPLAVSFLLVKITKKTFKEKEETLKIIYGVLAIILIISALFVGYSYYKSDKATAENFAPGVYQLQWQKAMSWVRENTDPGAVFAHWWDYGYWLQSIGERATVLDGGNVYTYWNHLMGRHVLTGPSEKESLEFLYAHNATHLLIDSTDIGKYTAFSSIGADENYDRFSWINTFFMDKEQTQETDNETIYVLSGQFVLDDDIIFNLDGTEKLLAKGNAAVRFVILKESVSGEFSQPEAVFIDQTGQQYIQPLRYIYFESGNKYADFGSGIEAGVFIFPTINSISNAEVGVNYFGAALFLSGRTVNSRLARYYLFSEKSEAFNLVHVQDSLFVEELKQRGVNLGNFAYFDMAGFQGPIKIWEINYPSNIEFREEFLDTDYPNDQIRLAQDGVY